MNEIRVRKSNPININRERGRNELREFFSVLVGGSWKVGEGSFGFCLVESELNRIFPVQLSRVGPGELGLLTPPTHNLFEYYISPIN